MCDKCKTVHWSDKKCPDKFWICWPFQDPDEWRPIQADSMPESVEKWAELYDSWSGDYTIVKDGGVDLVLVKDDKGGPIKKYTLTAETVIEYRATEIKEG